MRRVIFILFTLSLIVSRSGYAEDLGSALKDYFGESDSATPTDTSEAAPVPDDLGVEPLTDYGGHVFMREVGIYSCPEGTLYSYKFNVEKLAYEEKCEGDRFRAIMDSDRDGVEDSTQTSYINSLVGGAKERDLYTVAGEVSVSKTNPYLFSSGYDSAIEEFNNTENPFIKEVRDRFGTGGLDQSLVDQVRGNMQLQDKIRNKLQGSPLEQQFENFLNNQ